MSPKLAVAFVLCFAFASSVFGAKIAPGNHGRVQCEMLICPIETRRCLVTTTNDPNDFSTLIKSRKCLDKDNVVVAEEISTSPNKNNNYVNVVNLDFTKMTPEERAQSDANRDQMSQNIRQGVRIIG